MDNRTFEILITEFDTEAPSRRILNMLVKTTQWAKIDKKDVMLAVNSHREPKFTDSQKFLVMLMAFYDKASEEEQQAYTKDLIEKMKLVSLTEKGEEVGDEERTTLLIQDLISFFKENAKLAYDYCRYFFEDYGVDIEAYEFSEEKIEKITSFEPNLLNKVICQFTKRPTRNMNELRDRIYDSFMSWERIEKSRERYAKIITGSIITASAGMLSKISNELGITSIPEMVQVMMGLVSLTAFTGSLICESQEFKKLEKHPLYNAEADEIYIIEPGSKQEEKILEKCMDDVINALEHKQKRIDKHFDKLERQYSAQIERQQKRLYKNIQEK